MSSMLCVQICGYDNYLSTTHLHVFLCLILEFLPTYFLNDDDSQERTKLSCKAPLSFCSLFQEDSILNEQSIGLQGRERRRSD